MFLNQWKFNIFFDFTSMNIQTFTHFNILQIQQHDYPLFFCGKNLPKCKKIECVKNMC